MQNHRPPSIVVDDVVVSILLPTCIASGSLQTTVKSHIDGKVNTQDHRPSWAACLVIRPHHPSVSIRLPTVVPCSSGT